MTSYDFYRDTYGGELSEAGFDAAMRVAWPALCYFVMGRTQEGGEALSLASCAMADAVAASPCDEAIMSEAVGDWRRSYEGRTLARRLFCAALPHLAATGLLYRGCWRV